MVDSQLQEVKERSGFSLGQLPVRYLGVLLVTRGCNGLAPNLKVKHSYFLAILLRLAWSTYINSIWRERNQRQFGSKQRSKNALFEEIKKVIRLRLIGAKDINRSVSLLRLKLRTRVVIGKI
ncbi:hypothetical protein J1N35_007156 [Gossypium stocksii]|uniref:Uncharacterized protein n=1 Tax=Gossypium stocksii TaxID=47602 RepID=A0A9D3W7Z5_9ROSI|nr:hypothetical protein J1N35_007156 [Gossypium stocksii]